MNKMVTSLPTSILGNEIQLYLEFRDFNSLMNSNKEMCFSLKKETIRYKLTPSLTDRFLNERDFRVMICSMVMHSVYQLQFYIRDDRQAERLASLITDEKLSTGENKLIFGIFTFGMRNFSWEKHCMQSVHTLFISCPGKVDFDKCSLQQLKSLTIEFNDYFEDVSQFGNLASLKIGFCKSVNNLEGLRGVPYLYLIGCSGITTITPLGNHERLTLKYCENVTSVSFLSNVRSFTINDFEAVNLSSLIDVIFLNFCSLS
jgi:hypothetical protein